MINIKKNQKIGKWIIGEKIGSGAFGSIYNSKIIKFIL